MSPPPAPLFTVASFWVHRPEDYPDAPDYLPMLRLLERSCRRLGLAHIVLTDRPTAAFLYNEGITAFARDLPRNLMQALTESQARWLEHPHPGPLDTLFVGADCLVLRDPRGHLPVADLSLILRPGHKRHRINNGFMLVPAASRATVAPLFRAIADGTGPAMCDDMVAVEAALAPVPDDYVLTERAGLTVNFLPIEIWNGGPKTADDPASGSFVLHFRGRARKAIMLEWAARHLPGSH